MFQNLKKQFPEVFSDPGKVWNWDETAVSGAYGRKIRCFTPSSSTHGGARRGVKDPGKHVTAGIAVAACGNIMLATIATLFLIVSGKKVMPSWRNPLEPNEFTSSSGVVHWLCNKNWFPTDRELVVTKHGTVDKEVIIKSCTAH